MISDSQELPPVTEKITLEEIKEITIKAKDIKLSDECYEIISRIIQTIYEQNQHIENNEDKWFISDRRWKKIVNLMRVSAFCNGRVKTNIMDASIIADCIWQNEKQEEDAKNIVKEAIENYGLECKINFENLKHQLSIFTKQVDNIFFKEVISEKETDKQEVDEQEVDEQEVDAENFKKTMIDNIEFYIVRDSEANERYKDSGADQHFISVSPFYIERGRPFNRYYIDGTSDILYGYYKNNIFIETGVSDNPEIIKKYTIIKIHKIKIKTLVLDPFFKDKPNEGKKIIDDFNKNSYLSLFKQLKEELSSIQKQKEECYIKYSDNLFADNDYYLPVITKKLDDSKNQINDLIAKLAEQKERYDIHK